MKFSLKSFMLGVFISSVLFTSLSVTFANDVNLIGSQNITAFFNDIKIKINGSEVENMDVEPFIYQGRTFIPVRFVAEELEMEVRWNETTNTVELDTIKKEEYSQMSTEIYIKTEYKGMSAIEFNNSIYIKLVDIPNFYEVKIYQVNRIFIVKKSELEIIIDVDNENELITYESRSYVNKNLIKEVIGE
jgi:hypothetical protein